MQQLRKPGRRRGKEGEQRPQNALWRRRGPASLPLAKSRSGGVQDRRRCRTPCFSAGHGRQARIKVCPSRKLAVMKTLLTVVASALLLSACAQGGGGSGAGTGSITMYGTIDEGITVRK